TERVPFEIEGSILAVVFDDPNQQTVNTIILLFGAQNTAGDTFAITTASPIDPSKNIIMSLGITFGFQSTSQFSTVDVNGMRLTSSAGGQDDGEDNNGALITVGGTGDSIANPPPFDPPTNPRTDDELYDLRPFVSPGDTTITVFTQNPSSDDNITFAAFFFEDNVASIGDCAVTCPDDIEVSNDVGMCGAMVAYPDPEATQECETVVCNPPSGSVFPVGTTTVQCTGTAAGGGGDGDGDGEPQSICSFNITVRDTEPPQITCPQDLVVSTTGTTCTAEANYVLASATDNCEGVTVICLPPSGLILPVGTQTVNCTATDAAGNTSSCSFTITVRDGLAPTVTCPTAPINVDAGGSCAAAMPDVRSSVMATDSCTAASDLVVTQSIPVGAPLPPGPNVVTVSVTDSGGNTTRCQVTVNVTGGAPPSVLIEPSTVNLDSVNITKKAKKKKKKKVKPAQAEGSFTIQNTGCSSLTLTFRSLQRVTDRSRFNNADDTEFFSVFRQNEDGTPGEELIGRNVPGGTQVTLAPDETQAFIVRFEPTIPGVAPCTGNNCLRAQDVLPRSFISELAFDGISSTVRFNASVRGGVKLIDPQNPASNNPVVTLCRIGDEFVVRYHVFSPDKSDVRTVRYEFLDGSGNVVSTVDNVDLAGPLSQSSVANGQSFNVEHAFLGADSNTQVNRVRVTVSGSNSSSTGTSTPIGTNCGSAAQLLRIGRASTLQLPVARLRASKP
ncbi:MAG TPA: HYR domain-containing protein, partial [Blastocatellia bacterium]|nr:HYR domain-containing protein [Blastocatellia bacterium]